MKKNNTAKNDGEEKDRKIEFVKKVKANAAKEVDAYLKRTGDMTPMELAKSISKKTEESEDYCYLPPNTIYGFLNSFDEHASQFIIPYVIARETGISMDAMFDIKSHDTESYLLRLIRIIKDFNLELVELEDKRVALVPRDNFVNSALHAMRISEDVDGDYESIAKKIANRMPKCEPLRFTAQPDTEYIEFSREHFPEKYLFEKIELYLTAESIWGGAVDKNERETRKEFVLERIYDYVEEHEYVENDEDTEVIEYSDLSKSVQKGYLVNFDKAISELFRRLDFEQQQSLIDWLDDEISQKFYEDCAYAQDSTGQSAE